MIREQSNKSLGGSLTAQDFMNWPLYCNQNIDLKNLYKCINSILPTNSGDLTNKHYVDTSISALLPIDINNNTTGLLQLSRIQPGGALTMMVCDSLNQVVWTYTITSGQISDFTTAVNTLINAIFALNPTNKLSPGSNYQVLVTSGGVPTWSLINGYNILNYPANGAKFLSGDSNTTWRTLTSSDIPQTLTHSWVTDFDTQVNTHHPTDLSLCNASFNVNSNNIINVLDPTSAQMAATKNYVDGKFQSITGSTNTKIT